MRRRLLFFLSLALWILPAGLASANDTVTLTSELSTTRVWVFSPTPDQVVGLTKIEIVSSVQTRTVGMQDFLESLQTRGAAYVSFVGTVEDPDHPPMVIPTYPPETAQLILYRDNSRFCPGADQEPTADNLPLVRSATLCLMNLERTSRGKKPLQLQSQLNAASQAYAEKMVRDHFFDHIDLQGGDLGGRLERVGYWNPDSSNLRDITMGENIAAGPRLGAKPRYIVEAWMTSEGHRENLLDSYFTDVGVGIAPSTTHGDPGGTYVTDFGQRWFVKKKPKQPKKKKKKKKKKKPRCSSACSGRQR